MTSVLYKDSESTHQKRKLSQFSKLLRKVRNVSSNEKYVIRRMEKSDIKSALICLQSLGLTESVSTLEAFMDCDPNAFYVAVTQTDGRVIGMCGGPVTSHSTGIMGLYGVDKSFQNIGIGKQLFDLCLKHIRDRNCGLFSIPSKRHIYENLYNFNVYDNKELIIFAGIPQNIESINVLVDQNHEIKELRKEDTNLFTKIIEYDQKVHTKSRNHLLKETLNKCDYTTFALINNAGNQLLGYACIRTNIDGVALIGPVYADNDSIAEILVYNAIKCCETSQTNGLLYPTINCCESSHRIARKLGLKRFGKSVSIFTKYSPPMKYKLIYCIHSPNFSF